MADEAFRLPENFRGEVRLFPLPNVVMFPQNMLPLHIFESRYREMLEDALQADQLITMATLQPGFEEDYYSRPAIAPVVCIGRIVSHEKLADGKYNLVLFGLHRARVLGEIEPVRAFRRAKVEVLDRVDVQPDDAQARSVGGKLVTRLKQTTSGVQKLINEFDAGRLSLAALTDVVAFHLPFDIDFKLQLLNEPNPIERARCITLLLSIPQPDDSATRQFPPRFSGN